MTTDTLAAGDLPVVDERPHLEHKPGRITAFLFFAVLAVGLLFSAWSLVRDVDDVTTVVTTWTP
ncbi:hypothetical protein AADU03_005341, partial [Escherichia coli]